MEQKHALITGASEGIGRVFAEKLAKVGFTITAVARTESRLKELVAALPGQNHQYIACDLASDDGIEKVVSRLASTHYQLLINNAGFGIFGKFHETPITKLHTMTRLNCDVLTRLSYEYLQTAKKGDALLNVASTVAFHAMPGNAAYAATKAYVLSLSESLWDEQKTRGVYVLALCPGYTLTNFSSRAGADDMPEYRKFAQTADEVVDAGLKALKARKKPVLITGIQNQAMNKVQRLLPRSATVVVAGKALEKYLARSKAGGGANKA